MEDYRANKLCTIVVSSCDDYEDIWYPFFSLFKKYWPNCSFPIVLNTESKEFKIEGLDIKSFKLDEKHKMKWGNRLLKTLKKIDSKYIIFLLDDFLFLDYVNTEKINELIDNMENDSKIGVFSLNYVEDSEGDIKSTKYKGFDLRNVNGQYRFNCQAAIWRKDVLLKSLRKYESPWDWELLGNRRSKRMKEKFYTLSKDEEMIIKYDYLHIGLIRGSWGLPETKDFLESQDIHINYSKRSKINSIEKENSIAWIKLLCKKIRSYF